MIEFVDGDEFDLGLADEVLDATGLRCPMPLLKAKQALNNISVGSTLLVIATDTGSVRDFKSFVDLTSHQMLGRFDKNDCYYYLILKGE